MNKGHIRGWFPASAGADADNFLGGISVHDRLERSQQLIGSVGAVVGTVTGRWVAVWHTTGAKEVVPQST